MLTSGPKFMQHLTYTIRGLLLGGCLIGWTIRVEAQNNTITGTVFQDEDFDAVLDPGEPGSGAIRVLLYRDVNQDSILDGGDQLIDSCLSMPNGTFSFSRPFGTSITRQITVSSDDAEERVSNGSVSLTNNDLEMVVDGSNTQYVGMRFPNIAIPQGTSISSAYIDFVVKEAQSTATSVTLRGQAADNATTFTTTGYNISSRPLTTASVSWSNIPAWSVVGETKTSPDIKTIVQEVLNRPGWASGNAMVIRVNGSGTRTARSYDFGGGNAPTLRISYNNGNDYFLLYFDTSSIAPGAPYSSSLVRAVTFTGAGQSSTGNDFGYLGLQSSCFVSADNGDALHLANRFTGSNRVIGGFGVPNIEAIALNINRDTLWAADAGQLGTVNMNTGAFTALPQPVGTGDGAWGPWPMDDVDGLSYDPISGTLWGSQRESAAMDLIFKINRNTGAIVPDAFGAGVDYLVLSGSGMYGDLDDLAFNPTTGELYATNNDGGGNTQLIKINTTTGAGTIVANLGIDDVEGQGFSNDGNFYAVTGEAAGGADNNSFWRISISTGAVTKLSTFNSNGDFEGCDCLTGTAKNVITGTVFDDKNSDAVFNAGDIGYSSAEVYLHRDINENQVYDSTDILDDSTITNSGGHYVYIRNAVIKYVLTINYATLPGTSSMTTDSLETAPFTGLGQFDVNNNFGFDFGNLPVTLLSFDAKPVDDVVELSWSTATEINSSHYEVERSSDGKTSEWLMTVSSSGTVMTRSDYEATDDNPLPGVSYYRLKQVDTDGSYKYSSWVRVDGKMQTISSNIFPNPSTGGDVIIIVSGDDIDHTSISLLDIRGAAKRIPTTMSAAPGGGGITFRLDIRALAPGVYYVIGQSGPTTFSHPLVVQ